MNQQLKKYIDRECEKQERTQMKANDGKLMLHFALRLKKKITTNKETRKENDKCVNQQVL